MIKEYKKNRVCASSLFISALCNLNCKYCYIPKGSYMVDIHKKVSEKIKK